MKIHLAYCVELEKTVNIQEACQEFFAQEEHLKFQFYCSDPKCRDARVRVTAVNYNKLPEEEKIIQSPHFRKLNEHLPGCYWVELEEALHEESHKEHTSKKHRINSKLTHLITRFIPTSPEDKLKPSDAAKNELDKIKNISDTKIRKKELLAYSRNTGVTSTNLESLVSCFEELQAIKALNDVTVQIPKHGTKTYRQLFRRAEFGRANDFVIYYGGARYKQDNGKLGFSLEFMDKLDNLPITLDVASELFEEYRPGKMLRRIINELIENSDKNPYLKVYWMGSLEKTDKGYSAKFTSLAHVVLRLVYRARKSQEN